MNGCFDSTSIMSHSIYTGGKKQKSNLRAINQGTAKIILFRCQTFSFSLTYYFKMKG